MSTTTHPPAGEHAHAHVHADTLQRLRTTEDILPAALTDDSARNPAFEHLGMYRINPETGEPLFDVTGRPLNMPDQVERTKQALRRLAEAVKVGGAVGGLNGAQGADDAKTLGPVVSTHRMNGRMAALYKAVCPVHGDYFCNRIVNGYEVWLPPGCPTCRTEAIKQVEIKTGEFACELDVPPIFQDATFANYDLYDDAQVEMASRLKRYAKTFPQQLTEGRSMVFWGNIGTGKTHLAYAIAKEVVAAGYKAESFLIGELLKKAWGVPLEQRQKWMSNIVRRSDLLVLDELGKHSPNAGSINLAFEIINARTNERKPLLLISNLNPRELMSFYGEEIWSRIVRCSEVLEMNWPNYRFLNPNAGGGES